MNLSNVRVSLFAGVISVLLSTTLHADMRCKSFRCADTYFYGDASKTEIIGVQSTCPGRKGLQGSTSQWSSSEADTFEVCSTVPSKFPCEFFAKGCVDLPRPRF